MKEILNFVGDGVNEREENVIAGQKMTLLMLMFDIYQR